jgi:hypothetical protein
MPKEEITKMELLEIVERQEDIIVKLRKDNIEKENLIEELLKGYSKG